MPLHLTQSCLSLSKAFANMDTETANASFAGAGRSASMVADAGNVQHAAVAVFASTASERVDVNGATGWVFANI
jgi:hypothetical protein